MAGGTLINTIKSVWPDIKEYTVRFHFCIINPNVDCICAVRCWKGYSEVRHKATFGNCATLDCGHVDMAA